MTSKTTSRSFAAIGALALSLAAGAANAQLILSTTANTGNELAGLTFNDGDMVQTDAAGSSASIFFAESNWTSDGDTDAFHILPDGTYLFSSLFNSQIDGQSFDDADLIRYDPNTGTASTYFITESTFDDDFEDISGVSTRENGNILFSTLSDASIGGVGFTDGDIVEYDISTGTVSIAVAEDDIFDDGDGDIYGLHYNADGTYLLTSVADEMISGTQFLDGDIFLYDPANDTATLVFSEASFTDNGTSYDIDAIYVIPAPGTGLLLGLAGFAARRRRA
ncbi:MAG: hypothetical protein AAGG07_06460 [Planctomycetota bacterium]